MKLAFACFVLSILILLQVTEPTAVRDIEKAISEPPTGGASCTWRKASLVGRFAISVVALVLELLEMISEITRKKETNKEELEKGNVVAVVFYGTILVLLVDIFLEFLTKKKMGIRFKMGNLGTLVMLFAAMNTGAAIYNLACHSHMPLNKDNVISVLLALAVVISLLFKLCRMNESALSPGSIEVIPHIKSLISHFLH